MSVQVVHFPRRPVRSFQSWLSAQEDARDREACLVIDLYHRFWSVPLELTVRDVISQMTEAVAYDAPPPAPVPSSAPVA